MNTTEFDTQRAPFESLLGPAAGGLSYADHEFWSSIGTHPLDLQLAQLADFYGACNAQQRDTLRSSLSPDAAWNLVAYVRRMALRILETKDPRWLDSALQIASLENASLDYRDLIVSLVIARAAADLVAIDPAPHFAKAISHCDPSLVAIFMNASDHRPRDVRDILRSFGPPELKPQRKRRTG